MNQQLADRIRQCPSLPSLPAIAIQVLELAQQPDVNINEIATTISKDPALSSKILRTVNSSFYGRSQAISTVSNALVILGLQSVKTLVLGFSLVSNLSGSKNKGTGFKHLDYWRHCTYAATAARTLAAKLNIVQQEEAFLAALLADIGMLVLDQVLGAEYGEIVAQAPSHEQLPALETAALQLTHGEAGGILAAQWKLPPLLAGPITLHHSPEQVEDPALRKLTELVRLAGRCADVFVDTAAAEPIADVRRLCAQQHGLSESDADSLLQEIGSKTREIASLFEINIGSTADYEAILKRANETLVNITLQSQQQATALEREKTTLAEQNQQLKIAATTDKLTGLANRARFDAFLAEQFSAALEQEKPLSLLLLDVDKFKSINDRFGHPVGDKVLAYLGKLLQTAARAQDVAARYGGEELCLVLPGSKRGTAAAIAESIRRAIAARPVPLGDGRTLPVTASIGVASFEPPSPLKAPAHLLKAADLAVYAAKHAGRNCVRVCALGPKPGAAAA